MQVNITVKEFTRQDLENEYSLLLTRRSQWRTFIKNECKTMVDEWADQFHDFVLTDAVQNVLNARSDCDHAYTIITDGIQAVSYTIAYQNKIGRHAQTGLTLHDEVMALIGISA